MAQPYVGEIRMFAGNFAPQGWEFCAGQLLPISENDTLFNLIGTTYGGDGQNTFALPDLRGRLPVHQDSGFILGQKGGAEEVTLTVNEMPGHSHTLDASINLPTLSSPAGNVTGQAAAKFYRAGAPGVEMSGSSILPSGGSQSHENVQPFLCLNFIISLFGIFPSPN